MDFLALLADRAAAARVVSSHLPAFERVFTRPQMKNFARYATGLMISPNRTVSAMNGLFYAYNDRSALNNFITDSTWSDGELASSLGKTWVFQSKSDRVVLVPRGWVHLAEWAKTVPRDRFKPVKVRYKDNEQTYWCHEASLVMRSIDGERARVAVSYDNPEMEGEPNFYCSNRLDLKADKMLNVYAKRWKIDSFYRDAKQNLSMEDYEMRKIEGVRRHLAMVFIAHTLLVLGPVPAGSSSEDTKLRGIDVARAEAVVETIGSRCRRAYREVLVSFIALVLRAGRKLENDAERIASLALSSRARMGVNSAKV